MSTQTFSLSSAGSFPSGQKHLGPRHVMAHEWLQLAFLHELDDALNDKDVSERGVPCLYLLYTMREEMAQTVEGRTPVKGVAGSNPGQT